MLKVVNWSWASWPKAIFLPWLSNRMQLWYLSVPMVNRVTTNIPCRSEVIYQWLWAIKKKCHGTDGASLGLCNISQWYKDTFKCGQFNITSTRAAQVTGCLPLPLSHSSRIGTCLSPIALVFKGHGFNLDPFPIGTVLLCIVKAVLNSYRHITCE